MKNKNGIIFALALVITSEFAAHAITNTAIAVSGTNIVLSWPSYGYESYLIQYRQTLDPTDSWSQVVNAYPANSTNTTTYTLYGLVPPPNTNSVGSGSGGGSPPPSPSMAMVAPSNNSSGAVPLALYPPGFDLSSYNIFDPSTSEWVSGSGYSVSSLARFRPLDGGGSPMDETNGPPSVTTGFFRVFHIPDWLVSFDGYTFDGPTFLPVDFASPDAPTNYVDNLTVLINGQPTDATQFLPYDINGTTYWGLGVYFDQLPNGTNTIQLLTTVRQSDVLNDQTPYMTFSNAPQTIVIGNTISFTNWSDLILSNSYTINAQSSVTNVDWEIDIYDAYNNFVNYQTGHSDDGSISWTWDLTDSDGNARVDDNDPFFYSYVTVSGSSESMLRSDGAHPNAGGGNTTRPAPAFANQFPTVGSWLFTYLDNYYDDGTTLYAGYDSYYHSGINNMEGGPALWQIAPWNFAIKYGTNYTQAERDASWQTLEGTYLERWTIRNLYYFGHGAANSIGGDHNVVDTNGAVTASVNLPGGHAYLTSRWVRENITANKYVGSIPFRFVFLDGCNTATGDWPQAWGVPKEAKTIDYYQSTNNTTGGRPNAFAGWDTEVGGSAGWGTISKFWQFRQFWMANWSVNSAQENLQQAFSDALDGSSWVDNAHFAHLKIYGYTTMKFQDYNNAGNWP